MLFMDQVDILYATFATFNMPAVLERIEGPRWYQGPDGWLQGPPMPRPQYVLCAASVPMAQGKDSEKRNTRRILEMQWPDANWIDSPDLHMRPRQLKHRFKLVREGRYSVCCAVLCCAVLCDMIVILIVIDCDVM